MLDSYLKYTSNILNFYKGYYVNFSKLCTHEVSVEVVFSFFRVSSFLFLPFIHVSNFVCRSTLLYSMLLQISKLVKKILLKAVFVGL